MSDDDFGPDDGTEDTATQLAEAMQTSDSHNSATDSKTHISAEEQARVEALVSDSKGDTVTDHLVQLRVTDLR